MPDTSQLISLRRLDVPEGAVRGVIIAGSNSVQLVVFCRQGNAAKVLAHHKEQVRLGLTITERNTLPAEARELFARALQICVSKATDFPVQEIEIFATSSIRDVENSTEVVAEAGFEVQLLTGEQEAACSYRAAWRWLGSPDAALLVVDAGGGSVELALGAGANVVQAVSYPLGSGRLTSQFSLLGHLQQSTVREFAQQRLAELPNAFSTQGPDRRVVGTSKVFRTLALLATGSEQQVLTADQLAITIQVMNSGVDSAQLKELGISSGRREQLHAGALMADELFSALGISDMQLCPRGTREGLVSLRYGLELDDPGEAAVGTNYAHPRGNGFRLGSNDCSYHLPADRAVVLGGLPGGNSHGL